MPAVALTERINLSTQLREFSLSPDGKKVAVVARGEIFAASSKDGGDGQRLTNAAWSYPAPTAGFAVLRDHLAFYAAPFDSCTVGGEQVVPQGGGFYGGWITSDLAGPFKGVPGSRFW